MGAIATSPQHSQGFPNKRGQNQNWPTSGHKCYITPAFSEIPKQRGTKSELAHKWEQMLHHPCILGDSQTTGDKIRIRPQVGGNATSPLRSRGSPNEGGQNQILAYKWAEMLHQPCILGDSQTKEDKIRIGPQAGGNATSPLHSRGFPNNGGQNQNWPTSGRKCYITPAFSGIPKQRGTKSEWAHKCAEMLHHPCVLGNPQIREDKIEIGPQVGRNAPSRLHSWGFPNKRGHNKNWPTRRRKCYTLRPFSGIPKERRTKAELAHKRAVLLHHPFILGNSQTKGDKIRIGPQVGGNATSPLHSPGSPNKGGQNQNWPTSGRKCYTPPAFLGIPKIKENKSRISPQAGRTATSPLHSRGSPNNEGQNQNWRTSGRKCYITPAFSGIPKERGTKSKLTNKWAETLHHPCILGHP